MTFRPLSVARASSARQARRGVESVAAARRDLGIRLSLLDYGGEGAISQTRIATQTRLGDGSNSRRLVEGAAYRASPRRSRASMTSAVANPSVKVS